MNLLAQEILTKISTLPEEKQREALDFISIIKVKTPAF